VQTKRAYGGVEAQLYLSLTIAPDRLNGQLHATASLLKRKGNSVLFELRRLGGPRADMDVLDKRIFLPG
jgi:hypothetical protein